VAAKDLRDLDAHGMALALLHLNAQHLRQKKGTSNVTVKDLAGQMGVGIRTLYRNYGKSALRDALRPSGNQHLVTTKEQRDQAIDARRSKHFNWRRRDKRA
jgi:AcrR family transcriptional regulator